MSDDKFTLTWCKEPKWHRPKLYKASEIHEARDHLLDKHLYKLAICNNFHKHKHDFNDGTFLYKICITIAEVKVFCHDSSCNVTNAVLAYHELPYQKQK